MVARGVGVVEGVGFCLTVVIVVVPVLVAEAAFDGAELASFWG